MTNSKTETVIDLRTCDAAAWMCWALDQFNLFERAPRPSMAKVLSADNDGDRDYLGRNAVSDWIPTFKSWLKSGAANERVRTVAQFILGAWNDSIRVPGAASGVERVYGGMDETNRRGVRKVLEHARYF